MEILLLYNSFLIFLSFSFSFWKRYFKPAPIFDVNKDQGICTLYLPKSCPVKQVSVQANGNVLKQAVCLEACIQLHKVGALSDHLVPDMVVAETVEQKLGTLLHFYI